MRRFSDGERRWNDTRPRPVVFEAGPDGLDVICIGGRKPTGSDTEKLPDFWA